MFFNKLFFFFQISTFDMPKVITIYLQCISLIDQTRIQVQYLAQYLQ